MNKFRLCMIFVALCAALVASSFLIAQEWLEVPPEVAASHLLKHCDPVYPSFAKTAGLEGVVRIRVGINTMGRITSVGMLAGPPSFENAAMNCVTQNVYRPFEKKGHLTNVTTTVDVVFKLANRRNAPQLESAPKLMREDFTWIRLADSSSDVSMAFRKWLAADLGDTTRHIHCDDAECKVLQERLRDPNSPIPVEIRVIELAANRIGGRVYLVRPQLEDMCGATGNCDIQLVEENTSGVHSFAETFGGGYFLSPNSHSTFPNIFIAGNGGGGIIGVRGYSNVRGEWGELYCGQISLNGDEEQSEISICH